MQRNSTQSACKGGIMALVGLNRAAELTGKNPSTIHRAIKANRLSFTVSDKGERQIDVAELERVFGRLTVPAQESNDASDVQRNDTQFAELRGELAVEREKNASLRAVVDKLEDEKTELRDERNAWREQAQSHRLLLADMTQKLPAPPLPPRRGWVVGAAVAVVVLSFVVAVWWVVIHADFVAAAGRANG
jgi:hypothetical protein